MKFARLFSPIQIRGMEMRNRVVFPAMGTKMASEDKFVTQQLIDYHVARAEGGNGLNMVEVCSVHGPSAPKNFSQLKTTGIFLCSNSLRMLFMPPVQKWACSFGRADLQPPMIQLR